MTMPKELASLIEEENFNPSQVQVVEGGKNVMRPDVMNFLLLCSIASQAVKIRKYFDDRTPTGLIQPFTVPVTAVRQRVRFPWAAQSATFINDGPDTARIWINSNQRPPHTINLNEVFNIDFEVHKLKRFYLQCDPGNTASIRVTAQD